MLLKSFTSLTIAQQLCLPSVLAQDGDLFQEKGLHKAGACGSAKDFLLDPNNSLPDIANYPLNNYRASYFKSKINKRSSARITCQAPKKKLGATKEDLKAYKKWKKVLFPKRGDKTSRIVCGDDGE